jgi:Helicase associated domain
MSAEHRKQLLEWRERAWENGIAELTKFKAREGHCLVPRDYVERAYKLGQWVSVQRYSISAERRRRLDAIWFVWDWRDYAWEDGFAVLTRFKASEGHCRVPSLHIEGRFKLGQWVSTQRRKKDTMSAERRQRLDAIGFVWRGR